MDPQIVEPTAAANGTPWWLKAIYLVGVLPGIIAFLLWLMGTIVIAGQGKVQATLDEHMRDMAGQKQTLRAICLILANGDRVRESWCGETP